MSTYSKSGMTRGRGGAKKTQIQRIVLYSNFYLLIFVGGDSLLL